MHEVSFAVQANRQMGYKRKEDMECTGEYTICGISYGSAVADLMRQNTEEGR